MKKIIFAVVGMAGSGKTEVVKYLEKKGFKRVYFGELTLEEIKKRGLKINEKNEKKIREELRRKYGMAAYALLNLKKIEEKFAKDKVVIDGLYSWDEYKVLKNRFKNNLVIIAVVTPRLIRYQRLAKRPLRKLSFKEAEARDYDEIEKLAKGGPIAIADFYLINDKDFSYLYQQIDKICKNLLNK